jgi:hypothetical protein
VEQSPLLVDEQHLHRLQHLGEFSSSNVGVDVKQLPVLRLRERGQDGEGARLDAGLDGGLVDVGDVADVLVGRLVAILGGEDAGGDRTGAGTEGFEGGDKLEVLFEEDSLERGGKREREKEEGRQELSLAVERRVWCFR